LICVDKVFREEEKENKVKELNNRFGIVVTPTANTNNHRQDSTPSRLHPETGTSCPDCHVRLIRLGACFSCPVCGYGGCG